MCAFVPSPFASSFTGVHLHSPSPLSPLRPASSRSSNASIRMVSYPYTGSGYGSAGIPYAGNKVGQSFLKTSVDDIVTTAASVPVFSTLVSLLQETGLDYELQKGGPFTVFAPPNSAFTNLLEPHSFSKLVSLLRPENRDELKKVLLYHVVKGNISAGAIRENGKIIVETMLGEKMYLTGYARKVTAGSARVVNSDIKCSNGVIHVVGSLLVPMSYVPGPKGPVKKQYPTSIVSEVYGNMLSPRQALGIDPLPEGSDKKALTQG